jgi:hypothetical protein
MTSAKAVRKDNSTFDRKVALRRRALRELGETPVVMETHGGLGKIYLACYRDIVDGIVFDNKADKTAVLVKQRPTWAVYETNCEMALKNGVGSHLVVNFLDIDPYGEPWAVLDGFFNSDRPYAKRMIVVVNDGLRLALNIKGGGWAIESMREATERYGNAGVTAKYLQVCRDMMTTAVGLANYEIREWAGYYCGDGNHMTHYAAVIEKAA